MQHFRAVVSGHYVVNFCAYQKNIGHIVLHLHIETLKQRIAAINQLRVERALSSSCSGFRHVYTLLPVLFHYHQPGMPGYMQQHVPAGICQFEPNTAQRQAWQQLALLPQQRHAESAIIGLYSMGSTSSVGQNNSSDLDIWVCHQSWLDNDERRALQAKCHLLEVWCLSYGVQVSFFLIDENRFRHNQSGLLSQDNCGSMQHILLLEEFYRSAVTMAGAPILWNIVPVEHESDYDEYVNSLYAQSIIKPNEWLDLGGVGTLSAAEYFGASLWQVYKSIDSPYKAVLKTLLLEAYSWEYPDTRLLAIDIKDHLHNGEIVNFGLDPYCMMLERVTRYLQSTNDTVRLDLVRRCFYLKVQEKLTDASGDPHNRWRRDVLRQLVMQWGWDDYRLLKLDNRSAWKIEQVREAYDELLATMMQSYRNLIRFARRNHLSASASPQDIGILTRKLYAAFEVLPGKVIQINPQISPDLSEADLTFIHVAEQRANRTGWYLYNQAPAMTSIISHQPLEYSKYLIKLVAWSWFNGLLTPQTRFHIKGALGFAKQKLQQLVEDVIGNFPIYSIPATPEVLYSPCEIKQLAVIVNLEYDPTQELTNQFVHFDLHKMDVLSFGLQQRNLVGSVDLLYRNSWNEIRTLHFNSTDCMLDALKTILGKMHQNASPPDIVEVFCYSQHLRGLIRTRVQQLISECIALRLRTHGENSCRFKAIRMAGVTWGLFFESMGVSVQKLENAIEFYGAISRNKLHGLSIKVDSHSSSLPTVVNNYASEGIIQFFFEDNPLSGDFSIYILDETNQSEIYQHCEGSKAELVKDVSRFYSASHDRFIYGSSTVNFNLPQFYQIVTRGERHQVLPFRTEHTDIIN